jgi:hypothetical protein
MLHPTWLNDTVHAMKKACFLVFLLMMETYVFSQETGSIQYGYNPRGELNLIVMNADTLLNFFDASGNRITESQNIYAIDDQDDPSGDSFLKCYPNPADHQLTISFYLLEPMDYELILFNQSGQRLRLIHAEKNAAGRREIGLRLNDLSSGQYYLWFQSKKISKVKKIIKM